MEIHLTVPDKNGGTKPHILHGRVEADGRIHHTSISDGRGARDYILEDFTYVTEIIELSAGETHNQRHIQLGPGIIYRYGPGESGFINVDGMIYHDFMGFDDKPRRELVSPGTSFGGSMPVTIFQAREQPGIVIMQ